MPSKLAESIATRTLAVNAQGGLDGPYETARLNVAAEADEALVPVRQALEGLRWQVEGDPCWCRVRINGLHDEHCQRARELSESLKVK